MATTIQAVPSWPAAVLVMKCAQLEMDEVEYEGSTGDADLPSFDRGYSFHFDLGLAPGASFEILERRGEIVQAGFQVLYSRTSFLASRSCRRRIEALAAAHYGQPLPMVMNQDSILNYQNEIAVAYVSAIHVPGHELITFRVGNRRHWN